MTRPSPILLPGPGDRALQPDRPLPPVAAPALAGRDGRAAARGPARRLHRRARPLRRRRPDRRARCSSSRRQRGARGADDRGRSGVPDRPRGRRRPRPRDRRRAASRGWRRRSRRGGSGCASRCSRPREPFSTIVNFPKGKPIYTYPTRHDAGGRAAVQRRRQGGAARRGAARDDGRRRRAEARARGARGAGRRSPRASTSPAGEALRARRVIVGDRPQRRLPQARRAGRGPGQGLQPPARPEGVRGPGRARRRRRRHRARDGDRARHGRRARHPVLPQARVRAARSPRTSSSSRRSGRTRWRGRAQAGSMPATPGASGSRSATREVVVRNADGADETSSRTTSSSP